MIKTNKAMKQTTKNWIGAIALVLGSSAVTGAVVRESLTSKYPQIA